MTSLALRLEKYLDAATPTAMGAVASLRRIADETGQAVRQRKPIDVIIPANSVGGEAREVLVEPGRWMVEATLPSGEIINEEVEVASGQKLPVTLHAAEHSPAEWLAWQHLMGNIEGDATLKLMRASARDLAEKLAKDALGKQADPRLIARIADFAAEGTEYVVHKFAPLFRGLGTILGGQKRAPQRNESDEAKRPAADTREAPPAATDPGLPVVQVVSRENKPTDNALRWTEVLKAGRPDVRAQSPFDGSPDQAAWVYRFDYPGPMPEPIDDRFPIPLRQIVNVEWAGERYGVSLPLPWSAIKHEKPAQAEVMVRMNPLERRVQIGVAVLDETFGPLSGLMTASTLSKAAIAVEQAHEMLYWKTKNPLAAAAGGYILIAAGNPDTTDWHPWIENLENWFPDLPDGAILKGALRLRYPRNNDSPREAREAFLRAFDRGIPYFSAGVAWLLDGLSLFPDDPDLQEKAEKVQRVAQRLDMTQAFTVIRLGDRTTR